MGIFEELPLEVQEFGVILIASPQMYGEENYRPDPTQAKFDRTHWSVILPAACQQAPGATEALEQLCQIYWPPVYAFLRKQGRSPEDAQDITQGFFLHLLSRNRLGGVHPAKGKFRSFLLACLSNYLHNLHDRDIAQKRGGGLALVSIDISETEEKLSSEPATRDNPALAFERRWASVLIDQVLSKLKADYQKKGKAELFSCLQPFLAGDAARGGYGQAAARLGTSEGAVRVSATRLRDEFREVLRTEVGRTVSGSAEVNEEIHYLFRVLRQP